MSDDPKLYGIGGAAVGLLVGMVVSGSGDDGEDKKLLAALDAQTQATIEAVDERLAGVTAQLDAVTAKVGDLDAAMLAATESQGLMGQTVMAHVDGAMGGLTGQLDKLTEMATAHEAHRIAMHGSASSGGADAAAETAAAPEPEPAPEIEIDGTRVGETEMMLDGKARVFVSKIDAEAGIARVAVNGFDVQTIGGWQEATFEVDEVPCTLMLEAIVEGHAQMNATCG